MMTTAGSTPEKAAESDQTDIEGTEPRGNSRESVPFLFSQTRITLAAEKRKSPCDFHRKGLISMEPIVRFELTTY